MIGSAWQSSSEEIVGIGWFMTMSIEEKDETKFGDARTE